MEDMMDVQLKSTIYMLYNMEKKSPKEIFKSYSDTCKKNDSTARKMIMQKIINDHPEYTEQEVLTEIMNAETVAQLHFVSGMAEVNPIMDKEKDRIEIAECLKQIIKRLENTKGDIR